MFLSETTDIIFVKIPISITILARKLQLLQATYLKKHMKMQFQNVPFQLNQLFQVQKLKK